MRQRVKMAQALVHDPDLLILDEPLTGMDPLMRRKTIRFIKDWARAGKHIIVSSHILHEIESMTSNILLINNGRIVAEGNVHADPRPDRHASAHRVRARRRPARPGAPVSGRRRRAQPASSSRARWWWRRPGPMRFTRGSPSWPRAATPARSKRSPRPTTTCRRSSVTW